MFSDSNKSLIITYSIAIGICGVLVFVIMHFNSWFFPNKELKLNTYTPGSRGIISEKDLKFGVLSDKKFISLEPILSPNELPKEETTSKEEGTVNTKPVVRPIVELRYSSPFEPF